MERIGSHFIRGSKIVAASVPLATSEAATALD